MKKLIPLLLVLILLCSCSGESKINSTSESSDTFDIPEYTGEAYAEINNNIPEFSEDEITDDSYEDYGVLDDLGRCTECTACIGQEIMPDEERGDISDIHPTGWQTSVYDFIEDNLLYNRCHLIGYQLTGENDNEFNLITGTRHMNIEGMLPFENSIAEYVNETGNHVMYRVTPVFEGDNLLASGVHMEALSVEDDGEGISFNVYAFNVQPGVIIDYATGENEPDESTEEGKSVLEDDSENDYVLNTHTKKFHLPDCGSVNDMADYNKEERTCTRQSLIDEGYSPCGSCCP